MEVIIHSRVAIKLQVGYLRLELQGHSPLKQQQHSAQRGSFSTWMLQVVYSYINSVVHFFTSMLSYPQVLSSTPCTASSWDLLVDGLTPYIQLECIALEMHALGSFTWIRNTISLLNVSSGIYFNLVFSPHNFFLTEVF